MAHRAAKAISGMTVMILCAPSLERETLEQVDVSRSSERELVERETGRKAAGGEMAAHSICKVDGRLSYKINL